ncbi:L,D-transpeptidase family protein [Streptomyces sp. NPDC001914]|uniref:L,D-transpeptidase family protein n=1 Tax=Streptomyces sp. NPDC001914 TaxID=3364623 RepID=UPI003687620C
MRDIPAIGRRPRDTPPDRQGPGAATAAGFAPVASGSPGAGPGRCGGRRGVRQREAERWLKLRVDGKQSAGDCRAIRAFQRKHGVEPADGTAGPATWARMRALSAGEAPHERRERHERHEPEKGHKSHKGNKSHRGNEGYEGHKGHKRVLRGCPVRSYRVACVDLTRKRTWVQQRGRILYGPVPMRSGSVRHPTRTGWFRIYLRNRNHWSTLYNSPMPYAQFFSGGQAFHAVRGSIRTVGGSMGCVNLRLADARGLWKVLRKGDRVYVWGRRPRR